MWNAIKQLPAIDKAIVTLYLDELSYRQIGDIIGLSESNVGARLTRIKIKLRKKLKPA
jgi:RNA polymerase sigma-70 factor (ECF subfamily)